MFPDCTGDVCWCPVGGCLHTVVVWLMRPAACAWAGDGSSYKLLIPSPMHGEEMCFLIISRFISYLWVGVLMT